VKLLTVNYVMSLPSVDSMAGSVYADDMTDVFPLETARVVSSRAARIDGLDPELIEIMRSGVYPPIHLFKGWECSGYYFCNLHPKYKNRTIMGNGHHRLAIVSLLGQTHIRTTHDIEESYGPNEYH
jgi:hypothetical protein